jgi:hypothetical protein
MSNNNCVKRMFEAYKDLNHCSNHGFNASNFLYNYCDIVDKCWTRNQYVKDVIIDNLESNMIHKTSGTILYYGTSFDTPTMSEYELARRLRITKQFIIHNRHILEKELFRELGYYNYNYYTIGAMLHLNM